MHLIYLPEFSQFLHQNFNWNLCWTVSQIQHILVHMYHPIFNLKLIHPTLFNLFLSHVTAPLSLTSAWYRPDVCQISISPMQSGWFWCLGSYLLDLHFVRVFDLQFFSKSVTRFGMHGRIYFIFTLSYYCVDLFHY